MQQIVAVTFLAIVAVIGFCSSAGTFQEIYGEHLKFQQTLKAARLECQATLNVSEDTVRHHGSANQASSDAMQCFANCIFTKLGMFDDTNGFNADNSIEQFRIAMPGQSGNMASIRDKVGKCVSKKTETENACGWANRGFECFIKEGLSLG